MSSKHNIKLKDTKAPYQLVCFVSSPFTTRLEHVDRALNNAVSDFIETTTKDDDEFRQTFEIVWNRLDRSSFLEQNIQSNVLTSIKKSHFVVADITAKYTKDDNHAKAPNPSVMHEIGYATALNIPVFLIGEEGASEHLPANLKGSLVTEYKLKSLMDKKENTFSKSLAETICNFIRDCGAPLSPGNFIVDGYKLRKEVKLPYLISNAKERIYVLTTNLEYVNKYLLKSIEYALESNKEKDKNGEPVGKSFKVDVLTMDPESIVTNARAKQLSVNVAKFRDTLRKNLLEMRKFARKHESNYKIGTYVSLPTLIMFIIDDIVVWSVPFPSQQSRLVPHFVVASDDVTIQQFISYFFSVKLQAGSADLL